MKKLTVFFALLLCLSFAEMSAQTIRWEVSGNTTLQIFVNGINKVNVATSSNYNSINGVLTVAGGDFAAGDLIEVYSWNTSGNGSATVLPIITEDDPYMIERAAENDYNFLNSEHTSLYEWFTMPDEIPMYIGMNS